MDGNRELILIVEDDPSVQAALRRRLRFEGFRVETCERGDEALERLKTLQPDVVLLDLMLPGLDGLEVAERLRASGNRVPILMLTARRELTDKVAGLESGADDYLVKPFAIEELLARIRALIRRAAPVAVGAPESVLRYEDLSLNPATREVSRGGRAVALTPREFAILEHLLGHPRQVLTREQIYEAAWESEYLSESNVVDVNIKQLRDKLEAPGEPRLIQTVRGVGYSLRRET